MTVHWAVINLVQLRRAAFDVHYESFYYNQNHKKSEHIHGGPKLKVTSDQRFELINLNQLLII